MKAVILPAAIFCFDCGMPVVPHLMNRPQQFAMSVMCRTPGCEHEGKTFLFPLGVAELNQIEEQPRIITNAH